MAEIKSNTVNLTLSNGETIELTMNFARLLYLRSNGHEKEVNKAMELLKEKELDILQLPSLFYAAYLCANSDIKYTEDEFVKLISFDLEDVFNVYANLVSKKKQVLSKVRSTAVNKKAK